MRKCMMNWVSMGFIGLGGFLIGGAFGLAISKDEDDIWAEDAIKLNHLDDYNEYHQYTNRIVRTENFSKNVEEVDEIFEDQEELKLIDTSPYEVETEDGTVLVKDTSEGIVEIVEPYIISEEDFIDPNSYVEFDRNTLLYYEEDDVLATDRDEVIQNVEEIIGSQALTSFGYGSNNKDVVFVRNVKLGCNFEVIREEGSYQEMVLGIPMDDDYEKAKNFFKKFDDMTKERE